MARLVFRTHAIRRMFARHIMVEDVRRTIERGEIDVKPEDLPYPSRLVLSRSGGRALHVVLAENRAADELIGVTVYEPDPALWRPGFRRRSKG